MPKQKTGQKRAMTYELPRKRPLNVVRMVMILDHKQLSQGSFESQEGSVQPPMDSKAQSQLVESIFGY